MRWRDSALEAESLHDDPRCNGRLDLSGKVSLVPDRPVRGIPGIQLRAGDHVCAFYRDQTDRDDILFPFLSEGLRAGHKCICVVESVGPDEVRDALGAAIDHDDTDGAALQLLTPEQSYLRKGSFSMPAMLDFWQRGVAATLADDRFNFVRVIGEMPSALTEKPDLEEFLLYESELNRFAPLHPQVIVCLYDLDRFGGRLLIDILRTHPLVLLGGAVLENPYYLEPDAFLESRRAAAV